MSTIPLSAVLITHNAASTLSACLASLDFCAQILVVDSGSDDATGDLARQAGAQLISTSWRGFGPQKQFAVSQAAHDWVLCIDADEQITPALRTAILAALPAPPDVAAYAFARCNLFMGRALRHGEGYPDWCVRLFDRRRARWSDDLVHEQVQLTAPGRIARLAGDLQHDSAQDLETYWAKQNRYSTLQARAALSRGERASTARMLFSPLLRFIKHYLVRGGWKDGVPGLIHILIGCGASFAKYAKMKAAHTIADRTLPP
jgi:glycosyltransferase involved in cell wall biosynthesis